ncbi:MAG TPA: hypothetical protein PLI79_02920 [Mycobacterium sp.]|nr:hypothetical protein [Mycobacterium sp.]
MTQQPDLLKEFDSTVVPVYHGTRQSLGAAILRDGFCPTPVADQIAAVAQTYGVPLQAVHDHLTEKHRFSTLHSDRAHTISTTADEYKAGSWAERAPEATWDALRAVFVLTHPDLDDDWAMSDAAEFWVLAQRVDDPPVVVTVQAPMSALQIHGFSAGQTEPEVFRRQLSRSSSADPETALAEAFISFENVFRLIPGWRIPIEVAEVVAVSEPLPFRVYPSLLAYLSERSVTDLGSPQQCSAEWGPPGSDGHTGGDWWPFDRVWSLLSAQRRSELEEFADRSI